MSPTEQAVTQLRAYIGLTHDLGYEEMNIVIACEFSGIVAKALRDKGHNARSCDLLPCETGNEYHLQCDMRELNYSRYDMVIAFPDCTHLAGSGARWWKFKQEEQAEAIAFVKWIWSLPVKYIAIENPIGILSREENLGKPSQIIQPWQFGHGETKATCLWLKNLPLLRPTNIVEGRYGRVWKEPPSKDRWKNRSRTYQGIADAMAEQWGTI